MNIKKEAFPQAVPQESLLGTNFFLTSRTGHPPSLCMSSVPFFHSIHSGSRGRVGLARLLDKRIVVLQDLVNGASVISIAALCFGKYLN